MFEWNPQDYLKNNSAQHQWAMELLQKLHLSGSESVLDIGCGDGKNSAQMALQVERGHVLGIDTSLAMIEFAQKEFPAETYPNLSFERIDVLQMKYINQFDVVFSNATLHWVKDQRAVLKKIKQSLKPSGRILLQMGGKGNAASVVAVLDELIKQPPWAQYFQDFTFPYAFYGPEEYKPWLKEERLHILRVELIPKDMSQKGIPGLKGWIRTTWLPYIDRVPENLRKEFIDAIVNMYINQHPIDKSGFVHIPMIRLEIEALYVK